MKFLEPGNGCDTVMTMTSKTPNTDAEPLTDVTPEDGNFGVLHEKNLFAATMEAGLGKYALISDLLVREQESDLITVEQDGEEIARIHHGYAHSSIIVFADTPVTRQLLRENFIKGAIELVSDEELYPEVKPCAIWSRKIRYWGEQDIVNALTEWRSVDMGEDTKTGAEWFHAVYGAKLLK